MPRWVSPLVLLLLATPLVVGAQPVGKVYRIGFFGTALASGYVREVEWIRGGLRERGYVEGKNILIEYRWAEGRAERVEEIAAEFVALKLDAILTHGLPGALAAARATTTIPIVMADGGDPVTAGLARSLARPGGNVTGSFSFIPEELGKRLQLLKEAVPRMTRVAFLATPVDLAIAMKREVLKSAAGSLDVQVQEYVARDGADLPGVFNAMRKAGAEAVLVNNEPQLNSLASVIAGVAAVNRLPSVGYASFADAGGLLAYGANRPALYGRAAYFLDRIFTGTKPGDIPFERAGKFDLIVNLRTAKSLDVKVPAPLLARADRIIE